MTNKFTHCMNLTKDFFFSVQFVIQLIITIRSGKKSVCKNVFLLLLNYKTNKKYKNVFTSICDKQVKNVDNLGSK